MDSPCDLVRTQHGLLFFVPVFACFQLSAISQHPAWFLVPNDRWRFAVDVSVRNQSGTSTEGAHVRQPERCANVSPFIIILVFLVLRLLNFCAHSCFYCSFSVFSDTYDCFLCVSCALSLNDHRHWGFIWVLYPPLDIVMHHLRRSVIERALPVGRTIFFLGEHCHLLSAPLCG